MHVCAYAFKFLKKLIDCAASPSIEGLVHRWKIPHNVAGATIMAIGASTPELMAAFIGVFIAAESATGSCTVVGSVIFNHLLILGFCIVASPGQSMQMSLIEFSKDMFFYALAIALFVAFFLDGQVTEGESWCVKFTSCYHARKLRTRAHALCEPKGLADHVASPLPCKSWGAALGLTHPACAVACFLHSGLILVCPITAFPCGTGNRSIVHPF